MALITITTSLLFVVTLTIAPVASAACALGDGLCVVVAQDPGHATLFINTGGPLPERHAECNVGESERLLSLPPYAGDAFVACRPDSEAEWIGAFWYTDDMRGRRVCFGSDRDSDSTDGICVWNLPDSDPACSQVLVNVEHQTIGGVNVCRYEGPDIYARGCASTVFGCLGARGGIGSCVRGSGARLGVESPVGSTEVICV